MSKRNLTPKEQIAERDYYEKICRLERWQIISRLFDCMSAEISTILVVCMENAKTNETDEKYSVRCREERKLLNVILEGLWS